MIVARRNPGDQQTTSDFYWEEGLQLTVPSIVRKNARVEDLKNRFNQICHLPALDFSTDDNVGFGGRPSCRDMAAFNFQPQHIVANPYTFFFKADTSEHREKLRVIFPFVLGAIDATTLAKQRALKDTEREHDRLRRELEARLTASRAWEAEVESYYLQAQALGLLQNSPVPQQGWPLDKYMLELKKIPEAVRTLDLPDVQEGTGETSVAELTRLINEEDQLGQQIGSIRRRLGKLDQLSSSVDDYGATLTSQEDRLLSVGWLEKKFRDPYECPICSAVHTNDNPRLTELQTLVAELKILTSTVHEAPAKLDQEVAELRQELRSLEAAITKARQKRKYLETQSSAQAAQRQRVRQIYLFVGRVEQALENVTISRNVDELRERVRILALQITELRRDLDPSTREARVNAATNAVSANITQYAHLLKLEHAGENIRFNIRELTLQFSPLSGRTDFLWEVGSGQNWVGYHIAGLLALHEHFISLSRSPVPRFLMIDQPSQVYFPEAWPAIDKASVAKVDSDSSADIEGVRRIFRALSHFLDAVSNRFQIIVTEHAGSITWQKIPNVNLVGNWRANHDEFLIPAAWLL